MVDEREGTERKDNGGQRLPTARNFRLVHKEEEGVKIPILLSEGDKVTGEIVVREFAHGKVIIHARLVKAEDGSYKPFTYILSDKRGVPLASGRMQEPGKFRFWAEAHRDSKAKEEGEKDERTFVGRMSFEDEEALKRKSHAMWLIRKNNPNAYQDIVLVTREDGTPTVGVQFYDGSYVDLVGSVIEKIRDGEGVRKAPEICMAREWKGRPLLGTWKVGKYTPDPVRRILNSLSAAYAGQDEFPMFSEHPNLAVILRLEGEAFEIVDPAIFEGEGAGVQV